jgi:hypothetical protein
LNGNKARFLRSRLEIGGVIRLYWSEPDPDDLFSHSGRFSNVRMAKDGTLFFEGSGAHDSSLFLKTRGFSFEMSDLETDEEATTDK